MDLPSASERIREAREPAQIARVFPVMRELRTHHEDEAAFVEQVVRQLRDGYRLAYLESEN